MPNVVADLWPILVNQGPLVILLLGMIFGLHKGWWIMASNYTALIAGYEARLVEKDAIIAKAEKTADGWRDIVLGVQDVAERAISQ